MDIEPVLKSLHLKELPCPVIFSKKNLRFFELGAFIQEGENAWIEINPRSFFSIFGYSPEMVLKHELIHARRKDFEDGLWEEIIAYSVAKKGYQRFLGPFFSSRAYLLSFYLMLFSVYISLELGNYLILILALFAPISFWFYIKEFIAFTNACKSPNLGDNFDERWEKLLSFSKEEILKMAAPRVGDI